MSVNETVVALPAKAQRCMRRTWYTPDEFARRLSALRATTWTGRFALKKSKQNRDEWGRLCRRPLYGSRTAPWWIPNGALE